MVHGSAPAPEADHCSPAPVVKSILMHLSRYQLQTLFPPSVLDGVIHRAQSVDFRALAAKYNMPGAHASERVCRQHGGQQDVQQWS